ncbi:glycosyltransferase family 2 protein [Streptomyces sp. NPDC087440]|uniref:glycosyltransferase family 2 protein n=1 Tax=Streptomyces sp. NPDC087440 TaxID=3365790 RepID=UPI0038026F5D
MAPRVSVLVPVPGDADPALLDGCFSSLFAQTLAPREVDLVAAVRGEGAAADWVAALAPHRAQIRVVTETAQENEARHAQGAYVLRLDPADRLAPDALEHLVAAAEESGADQAHGRSAGDGEACVLRRSTPAKGEAATVAVDRVCHYPAGHDVPAAARVVVRQRPALPRWRDGRLHLTGTAGLTHTEGPPQKVVLLLRHGGVGGTEVELPADRDADGRYSVVLDPASVGQGRRPLADGNWTLRIRITAGGLTRTAWLCAPEDLPEPVPHLTGGGATPVVPATVYASVPHHHLNLDIGARRHRLGADARATVTRRPLFAPHVTAAVTLPGCPAQAELDLLLVRDEQSVVLEDLRITRHPGDRFTLSAPLGAVEPGEWGLALRVADAPFSARLPLAGADDAGTGATLKVPAHWKWTRRLSL